MEDESYTRFRMGFYKPIIGNIVWGFEMGKFEQELDAIAQRSNIPDQAKKEILDAVERSKMEAERQSAIFLEDKKFYRGVLIVLGLAVLITTIGGLLLTYHDPKIEIPQFIVAIGTTALGALAGLLAPSPTHAGQTPP